MADPKNSARARTRIPLSDDWSDRAGELLRSLFVLREAEKRLLALSQAGLTRQKHGIKSRMCLGNTCPQGSVDKEPQAFDRSYQISCQG